MTFRVGVDIGGTFTDFALLDERSNTLSLHKELTTPEDPSEAVLRGVATLLNERGVAMRDVRVIDHGTTLVTNAVIEHRGVPTGMLVTAGLEDVMDIGEERRYDLFDLRLRFPEPIVPRQLRRPIAERMHYSGRPVQKPDLAVARVAVRDLVDNHGVQSVAVCLLHSYANPAHELALEQMVRAEFPELFVSTSADVLPFLREFQRWTTTAINAYVQPVVDRYLSRIEGGLAAQGFDGHFLMMTSSGGTVALDTARRYPVRLLESGPAAGALMSAYHGRRLARANMLSFDMGGTTAKGALVRNGQALKKYGMEVARAHNYQAGSGYPVRIPTIDLIEIGSGGGSIAEIDERGLIRVGPRSAGASPGPACYGQGGAAPTLTDANLVLGYLDPRFFLGGRMKLDIDAAKRAIGAGIADPLGLEVLRAAWGVHETVNEDVARAFRVHASERGFDYRQSCMTAFGGSGPMHAVRIARKLRVPEVILPAGAGVMSALGLLVSPLSFDTIRSYRVELASLDASALQARFKPLVNHVMSFVQSAGPADARANVSRKLDMRYVGQGHEVEVTVEEDTPAAVAASFERAYRDLYGSFTLNEPLEVVNWKVEVHVPRFNDKEGFQFASESASEAARKGTRPAFFAEAGKAIECAVYNRYAMPPGFQASGPALIEERESTCVIGPADAFKVDTSGNIVIAVGMESTP